MKAITLFAILLYACHTTGQPLYKFDYTLIFGSQYQGEAISLQINKKPVFYNYRVNTQDPLIKGNLNLIQAADQLKINFNGVEIYTPPVAYEHVLNLKMTIDKKTERLQVDLRKGNIIVLDYNKGALAVQQIQEPFILDNIGLSKR